MNPFAAPAYLPPFLLIMQWLMAAVLMTLGPDRADASMVVAIRRRLRKLVAAFVRLVELVAQGKYAPRPPKKRDNPAKRTPKLPEPGGLPPLPRRFGWLYGMMRPEASHAASHLDNWLRHSGVAEFVQAVPEAARILRALAHIVGLKSDLLALPKRARAKKEPAPKAKPAAWPFKGTFKPCEVEPGHTFPPMGPDAEIRAARLAAAHEERRRRKREKSGYSPA